MPIKNDPVICGPIDGSIELASFASEIPLLGSIGAAIFNTENGMLSEVGSGSAREEVSESPLMRVFSVIQDAGIDYESGVYASTNSEIPPNLGGAAEEKERKAENE